MRKRLIGWKLQQISRRQRNAMEEERKQAGLLIEKAASGIKNTEKLLESFYPNVQRVMQEKNLRNSLKLKQMDEEQKLSMFWQKVKTQALDRKETDCPICYNAFVTFKETALLDCSHIFHANCLTFMCQSKDSSRSSS